MDLGGFPCLNEGFLCLNWVLANTLRRQEGGVAVPLDLVSVFAVAYQRCQWIDLRR